MADQLRGRTRRDDDTLVPLVTGLIVLAAAGPALFTAGTQWLLPRLSAGTETASLSLVEWWGRNWWLVLFWAAEVLVLLAFLGWSRRRRRRRQIQLESVAAGLARVLPEDWSPQRHLRVLRWRGSHPTRVRLELSPRSPVDEPAWRRSVTDAATRVLGPLGPVAWPSPPRTGVFDWAARPPRIELRVVAGASEDDDNRTDLRATVDVAKMESSRPSALDEGGPFYRRPVRTASGRSLDEHRPAPDRLDRED